MKLDRRRFITGAGAAGIAGVAGCSGGPSEEGTADDSETEMSGGGEASASAHVGVVYATGGLGDGSFNDQAQQGVRQAAEDFDVESRKVQPQQVSDFENLQRQFAQEDDPDYDLVSCIGFLQGDALSNVAPEFPEQSFQVVDAVPMKDTDGDDEGDEQFDNVGSYVFAEEEGSFLVGTLAGLLSTRSFSAGSGTTASDSTSLGFVGGVESGLIAKFEAGFVAGAKSVSDDLDVQTAYTGSFNDPTAGKEAALQMYNSGADIVYHASGNTGTGVFQAAQEEGRFAIGVDRDQSVTKSSYADVILASMVKRVDTAVYSAIEATVNGSFEGGTTTALGLADDGVGITYGQELGADISAEVTGEVDAAARSIIDGNVDVPTDPTNV